MAILEYKGEKTQDPQQVKAMLASVGVKYDQWLLDKEVENNPEAILQAYSSDVERLKQEGNYITADVVALSKDLPNLEEICKKFDKEHHHSEDEVRFTVNGEGVFEIADKSNEGEMYKFTAEKGDLIVVPANRRHLFYLTDKQHIQCIRLFKTKEGWEAIYDK